MQKTKVHLMPKPGVPGSDIKVVIEAFDSITAVQMAKAQYGDKYRVISHARVH